MQDANHPEKMRHSLSHIMAAAIQSLYPTTKFGIGPSIDQGFYYDIDLDGETISETEFKKIEKKMREIVNKNLPVEQKTLSVDEALKWAKDADQPYKVELINDLVEAGEVKDEVSFYQIGDFLDLCCGPHLDETSEVGVFKLQKVAGAYWRGDEKREQMQRIYGVAFATQAELDEYLIQQEEAKKRDHRKLGQELDLFTFSDLVGAGLPMYTPRGTILISELKNILNEVGKKHGFLQVSIPHLAKIDLYEKSGHAQKFQDELFRVISHYDQEFVLKPVNCPHHTQIYASRPRSYRDLPLRYIEQTMQYRDEKPGAIGGLQRTRGFTVDDGHTFCRIDQIEHETSLLIEIIRELYTSLGLWGNHWVSWSVRDPRAPEKYIGDLADWDKSEEMLREVAEKYQLDAKRMEGEAAIYGPKIDFMFKDSLGRETQLATVQLDFSMPKRFGLTYTDQDGSEQTPVMIHRAIFGSFERFIMLLIEHFAGKFPVWLSPEQLRVICVNDSDEIVNHAKAIERLAHEKDIRVSVDDSNNSVSKKIRTAESSKVPYSIVIGEKEVAGGKLSPRIRADLASEANDKTYDTEQFLDTIAAEAKLRVVGRTTL